MRFSHPGPALTKDLCLNQEFPWTLVGWRQTFSTHTVACKLGVKLLPQSAQHWNEGRKGKAPYFSRFIFYHSLAQSKFFVELLTVKLLANVGEQRILSLANKVSLSISHAKHTSFLHFVKAPFPFHFFLTFIDFQ